MKNIKRKYYPLAEASKVLNCSINDIYHLGATRRIEICMFIPKTTITPFYINLDEGDKFLYQSIKGKGFLMDDYFSLDDLSVAKEGFIGGGFYCEFETLSGFFSLFSEDIMKFEFIHDDLEGIEPTALFSTYSSNYDIELFNVVGVKATRSNLVIMADAIENFDVSKVGSIKNLDNSIKRTPNASKQNKLIKSLIEIHYGLGSSENIRSLLNEDRGTGEMLLDFQKSGIIPPVTGRALAGWLEDVEIERVEITTPKKEISTK